MKTKTFFPLKKLLYKDCFKGKENQQGGDSHVKNLYQEDNG